MRVLNWIGTRLLSAVSCATIWVSPAIAADPTYGQPVEGQTGFQLPATPVMQKIHDFYDPLLLGMALITLFVLVLLIIIIVKFNAKANPIPSKTSHNTLIEVIWTVVPIIILFVIAVPSFRLLYLQDVVPEADMTIKAIGQQWYWDYEYPDHGDFAFTSTMVEEEDLVQGQPRLLATDEPILVPVNKTVRLLVTAGDVVHAWAIPSFGVKIDAVPGRINETWFRAEREGIYYGQCSELCGSRHAFMPIEVHVVSQAEFDAWVGRMQDEYGSLEVEETTRLAFLAAH